MNTEIIVALITVLGVFIANAAIIIPLWLWNRSESRSDMRNFENKTSSILERMEKEQKDFHAKLCVLEERYLQILSSKK